MAEIDFKGKLPAILSADAIVYRQLMSEDEEATAAPWLIYSYFKGVCHE